MSIPEVVLHRQHAKRARLIARAEAAFAGAILLIHPCNETSLRGAAEAIQPALIRPTLIGPSAKIASVAHAFAVDIARFPVVIILTSHAASVRTRMASCAVAVLYADARRRTAALQAP